MQVAQRTVSKFGKHWLADAPSGKCKGVSRCGRLGAGVEQAFHANRERLKAERMAREAAAKQKPKI